MKVKVDLFSETDSVTLSEEKGKHIDVEKYHKTHIDSEREKKNVASGDSTSVATASHETWCK